MHLPVILKVAEQIRTAVEKAKIPLPDGSKCNLTISIGVHTVLPTKKNLVSDFVSGADDALYTPEEINWGKPVGKEVW